MRTEGTPTCDLLMMLADDAEASVYLAERAKGASPFEGVPRYQLVGTSAAAVGTSAAAVGASRAHRSSMLLPRPAKRKAVSLITCAAGVVAVHQPWKQHTSVQAAELEQANVCAPRPGTPPRHQRSAAP